ncbi:MAG: DUF2066 domain-containing protein [Gammaproteobacteria bacterium]|nr:DUF2066 domain-containing protein [Gammaproteobacteria bacterium]
MKNKLINNVLGVFFLVLVTTVFAGTVIDQSLSETIQTSTIVAPESQSRAPLPAQVQPSTPYMVEVLVDDYGNASRKKTFIDSLGLMLVRTSNDPKVIELPAIKEALSKPEIYIKQFNYISKTVAPKIPSLFLQIKFDPKAISQLLKRSSNIRWIKSKPSVLVWLAQDMGRGKILVDEGSDGKLTQVIKKRAQELETHLMFPMWDLQDINGVKPQDICHFNIDAIKAASLRYSASSIAIGCVKQSILGGIWSTQWFLLQGAKSDNLSFIGDSADSVLVQAMQDMSSKVNDVTTRVVGKDAKVVLRIVNVNGLDQYNEVIRYLQTFGKVVTQVDLMNINSTDIELSISVVGGQQALLNILSMHNRLIPNPDVTISPPGIDLDYKWVTLDNEKSQADSIRPLS